MLRVFMALIFMSGLISFGPTGTASAQNLQDPPSFPVACMGGGNMSVDLHIFSSPWMYLNYEKATTGVAAGSLQPGQCAWYDRPMNAAEPSKAIISDSAAQSRFSLSIQQSGSKVTSRGAAGDPFTYLIDGMLSGSLFYFHAYTGSCGGDCTHLIITRLGP
ncbi:MAG: hypothetical protein AAFR98_03165 [Pseudomonadota bacterium]